MLSKNMADLDTVGPVVWPKWCYTSNQADNDANAPQGVPFSKTPTNTNKARRKKIARSSTTPLSGGSSSVKDERCSPDPEVGTESSRSDSPHSPGSSFRTRTPSNSSFTPPDRFSPANYNPSNTFGNSKFGGLEGLHMSRNYSDFMRSLAAKYTNSNSGNSNNEHDFRSTNYLPMIDSRFSSFASPSKSTIAGLALAPPPPPPPPTLPTPSTAPNAFPLLNLPVNQLRPATAIAKKEMDSALLVAGIGVGGAAGVHSFPPMMDMSSTQALLNIVRSASAQNAQQLESYLRGNTVTAAVSNYSATKRTADAAGLTPFQHHQQHGSPLDLSASVAKRRCVDSPLPNGKRSPPTHNTVPVSPRSEKRTSTSSKSPLPVLDNQQPPVACRLVCAADLCTPAAVQVNGWSVDEVVDFVKRIDLCAEYVNVFREHSIDGSILPLLTEEHLTVNMNMKLGPALKLRATVAKLIGHCALCLHCVHCHSEPHSTSPSPSQPNQHQSCPEPNE